MNRPNPEFTREQEDWLCYEIGEWYLDWKHSMAVHLADCETKCNCGQHRLGVAKEMLKMRICNLTNP